MTKRDQTLPIAFILITLMIDAMGIGLIVPVVPDLIRDVSGGTLAQAAIWGGIMSTCFAVMQFLFGPLVGNLSDRYGRRPVLLISLGVMALDYLVMAFAGTIWLLLAGRVVGGIAAATQSTATAYVADISRPEEKAARFGLTSAAFGAGFVLGPVIGGFLGEFGPRAPFYAAAALATGNLILGYFALPETVTDRIRRPFEWRRANPFAALRQMGRLPGVQLFLLIFFVYEFALVVYPATWSYFTQARFDWSSSMIGVSLATYGVSVVMVQAGLIRPILKRLGEYRTALLGICFSTLAFVILSVIESGTITLIFMPIAALGGIAVPALQGIMSRRAGDDQQGELQGVITSIRAIALIGAPIVMTRIFSQFTSEDATVFWPGAPFALSAVLVVVSGAVFVAGARARAAARR